jgi:hypothetical protein
VDEHDRDFGQSDTRAGTGPDTGADTGQPEAAWPGSRRVAVPRDEPRLVADPGRNRGGAAGRDPHGLEPDRAMPSWRARRGGLDLGRMGKVAGGLALAAVAVAGGWSMLGRRPHEIPVIEAPAGPLRVRPENPGGMQLANGVDTAPEGTGTLAPPPEVPQPGALRAQIQAGAAAAGLAAGAGAVPAGATPPADQTTQGQTTQGQTTQGQTTQGQTTQGQTTQGQTTQGRADTPPASPSGAATSGVVPAPPANPAAAAHVVAAAPAVRGAAPSAQPGPAAGTATSGPVAAGGTTQLATAGAHPAGPRDAASRPPASAVPDPAAVAASPDAAPPAAAHVGATVQLAALDSEQGATAEWQRLQHRMPELLGARRPEVQRAEHDGHPIWRLRTGGFATLAQAAEFCIQVRAKGTGCSIAAF